MPILRGSNELASNEDGQSDTSSLAYYTNEEIAILHAIVSEAQQAINSATKPKPLPIASLFRAYDQVLPQHDIDPDDDKHLSAFVFRVGGEIGDGDLVDKFQAILERMGIALEFSDTSEIPTFSPVTAHSWREPSVQTNSVQGEVQEVLQEENQYDAEDEDEDEVTDFVPAPIAPVEGLNPEDDSGTDVSENDELSPETLAAIEAAKHISASAPSLRREELVAPSHRDLTSTPLYSIAPQTVQTSPGRNAGSAPKFGATAVSPRRHVSSYLRRPTLEAQQPWSRPMPPRTLQGPQQLSPGRSSSIAHVQDKDMAFIELQQPQTMVGSIPYSRQSLLSIMDKWRQAASERKGKGKQRVKFAETVTQRSDSRSREDNTTVRSQLAMENGRSTSGSPIGSRATDSRPSIFEGSEMPSVNVAARQEPKIQQAEIPRSSSSGPIQDSPHRSQHSEWRTFLTSHKGQTPSQYSNTEESHPEETRQSGLPEIEKPIVASQDTGHMQVSDNQTAQESSPCSTRRRLAKANDTYVKAQNAQEERLLRRAIRARELFLASKVFNHWADKTARRLEREAVARRHMIRFRCFRAWAQTPSSKAPEVDHLRVLTAAQKLRRAVTYHEELFREVAATAVQARDRKMITGALHRWQCHVSRATARQQAVVRAKQIFCKRWLTCARDHAALRHAVASHRQRSMETHALLRWRSFAEDGTIRTAAAQHIGVCHLSTAYLREWWDQAEVKRRAGDCRRYILTKKASRVFDQWNLQTRAQAFIWRNEYITLNQFFDFWQQNAGEDSHRLVEARLHSQRVSRVKFVDALQRAEADFTRMEQVSCRARKYIGGTRLVEVFGKAVTQRKVRDKQAVKQYLMARYQQMSAARKKRNFYLAFDRWRTAAVEGAEVSLESQQMAMGLQKEKYLACVANWADQAFDEQQRFQAAKAHNVESYLRVWFESTDKDRQQAEESRSIWMVGKHRECTRKWTILSLQQGGHAHTANTHRRRHTRDTMNRALQQWKANSSKSKSVMADSFAQPELQRSELVNSFRNSSRTMFRRSQLARSQQPKTPLQSVSRTPVRWRGQSLARSGFMSARAMPPVTEVDELRSPTSSTAVEAEALISPSRPSAAPALPSTTPRAPIPTYLSRHSQAHTPSPSRPGQVSRPQLGHGNSVVGPATSSTMKERSSQASPRKDNPTQTPSELLGRGSPWAYTGSKSANQAVAQHAAVPDDEVFATRTKGQSVGPDFGRFAQTASLRPTIFSTPAGRRLGDPR